MTHAAPMNEFLATLAGAACFVALGVTIFGLTEIVLAGLDWVERRVLKRRR